MLVPINAHWTIVRFGTASCTSTYQLGGSPLSIQIAQIILYAHDGRTRSIPLERGRLNILTGPPLRGKTQLIEIIDYCLGRGTPTLAPGAITERVAWFALLLSSGSDQLFIARRAGHNGKKTSEEVYFDRAVIVSIPSFANLRGTHNVDTLVDELDGILGIKHNEVKSSEASARDPFKANTRHAQLLSFQAKHEIANPSLLFHRQGEDQGAIGRDLLATLPYFLGAVSEQTVTLEAEATRIRREIRVAERRFREEELVAQDRRSRAELLRTEAVAVGLIQESKAFQNYDQLIDELKALVEWTPRSVEFEPSGDAYQQALRERADALREQQRVRRDIDEARAYAAEQASFVAELQEQKARLASVGLFAHLTTQNQIAISQDIRDELAQVQQELESAIPPSSDLGKHIETMETKRADLRITIQRTDELLDNLSSQVETLRQVRESDVRQAGVVGRISLFVESLRTDSSVTALQQRIARLKNQLERLEEQLAEFDSQATLQTALGQVGGLMKAWAGELGHEYQDANWRLDLSRGTVVTHGARGTVPMSSIGGGENILKCHLFAHMALHLWLRGNAAPTFGFLVLDRPSRGLAQEEKLGSQRVKHELSVEEHKQLSRIIEWIGDLVKGHRGDF